MSDDFKAFTELGQEIARRGYQTALPADDLLKANPDRWPIFQSAAILGRLTEIVNELRSIKYLAQCVDTRDREDRRVRPKPSHPVADGLLSVMAGIKAGRVGEQDFTRLSIRARRTLRRLADVPLSDLTEDMLLGVRNCGMTTALEILEWRDRGGVA